MRLNICNPKVLRSVQALPCIVALTMFVPGSLATAQSISGRITMGTSGLAVRGGSVILVDLSGHPRMAARSDSTGWYRITAPSAGTYKLRVQGADGLVQVETEQITLAAGGFSELNVALPLSTAALDTVRVSASRLIDAPPGNKTKYDAFYRRKELGFGQFLMRQDIEKTGMNQTSDVIRKVPGMLVSQSGTKVDIQSKRCSGSSVPGGGNGGLGGFAKPDKKLEPMLFVDGARVRDVESLNDIHPDQIEAIEVYQGAAEVPAEAKGDACAAIFIWLRQ